MMTANAMPADAPALSPEDELFETAGAFDAAAAVATEGDEADETTRKAEGGMALKVSVVGAEQSARVSPQHDQALVTLL